MLCCRSLKAINVDGLTIELEMGYRKYTLVAEDESAVLVRSAHAPCFYVPSAEQFPVLRAAQKWRAAINARRGTGEAQPAWAQQNPFDEDDEDDDSPGRRPVSALAKKGKSATSKQPAGSAADELNPFSAVVGGQGGDYTRNYAGAPVTIGSSAAHAVVPWVRAVCV